MELRKNSMEFHLLPWVCLGWGGVGVELEVPWNSMELGGMKNVSLNAMELQLVLHGIPWNHIYCSNVVRQVRWNGRGSSVGLFLLSK